MTQPNDQPERAHEYQVYDNMLKRLVEHQASTVIPQLLGPILDPTVVEELNVEVLVPPRRTDRVYKIRSNAGLVVLDLEFETSARANIDIRLLNYHTLLLGKYGLPVKSVVLFPFAKSPVTPPLVERDERDEILRFSYHTVCLPELDARTFVEQGAVPIYGLLPAMGQTSDALLLQSLDEMVEYYKEDENLLRDEILCFNVLLQRATPGPGVSLDRMLRRIRMFDSLLDEDPWVKEKVAEGRAEGEAKGRTEGRAAGALQNARNMLVRMVQRSYPGLLDLAYLRAAGSTHAEVLSTFIERLWETTDEQAARRLFETEPTV